MNSTGGGGPGSVARPGSVANPASEEKSTGKMGGKSKRIAAIRSFGRLESIAAVIFFNITDRPMWEVSVKKFVAMASQCLFLRPLSTASFNSLPLIGLIMK